MRKITSFLLLSLATAPVFAFGIDLPEPESLSLLAIGALALLVSRRKGK